MKISSLRKDLVVETPKTAAQRRAETREKAENLPLSVKKIFWAAMTKDGKNIGEARKIAGIDDVMIAVELVIMFHKTVSFPMKVDDIE